MKILVTGCGGYIGSSLCEILTRLPSYEVHGLDNFMWKNEKAVAYLLNRSNFSLEKKDIRNLSQEDLKYDVIIHLAALVGAPLCSQRSDTVEINTLATKYISNNISPNTKLLYPNSNSGYGYNEGICTEETPLNCLSLYGTTKYEGEKYVLDRDNSAVFRLATVFGVSPRPRMDLMVNNFVGEMYFNGKMTVYQPNYRRNFVGINDVCRAFIFGMHSSIKGVYNVGLDEANSTKMEFAEKVKAIVNPLATITTGSGNDPDQRNYTVSSEKIKLAGFKFTDKLEDACVKIKNMCQILGPSIMNERNY